MEPSVPQAPTAASERRHIAASPGDPEPGPHRSLKLIERATGKPVAGATVHYVVMTPGWEKALPAAGGPNNPFDLAAAVGSTTHSDANGEVSLPRTEHAVMVAAYRNDLAGVAHLPPDAPYQLLLQTGEFFAMRTVRDGQPVPNIPLALYFAVEGGTTVRHRVGITDARGVLAIKGATYLRDVVARFGAGPSADVGPDWPGGELSCTRLPADLDGTSTLEVRLPDTGTLVLECEDGSRHGSISLEAVGGPEVPWPRATDDVLGTRLVVPVGCVFDVTWSVADGIAPTRTRSSGPSRAGETVTVRLAAPPAPWTRVVGRIRGAAAPHLDLTGLAADSADGARGPVQWSQRLDLREDGRFGADVLTANLVASEWLRLQSGAASCRIARPGIAGSGVDLGTLELTRMVKVGSLEVVDEAGQAIAGAEPMAMGAGAVVAAGRIFEVLADQAETVTVRATAPMHLPQVVDIEPRQHRIVELYPAIGFTVSALIDAAVPRDAVAFILVDGGSRTPDRHFHPDEVRGVEAGHLRAVWSAVSRGVDRLVVLTLRPPAILRAVPVDVAAGNVPRQVDLRTLLRRAELTRDPAQESPAWIGCAGGDPAAMLDVGPWCDEAWLPAWASTILVLYRGRPPVSVPAGPVVRLPLVPASDTAPWPAWPQRSHSVRRWDVGEPTRPRCRITTVEQLLRGSR